MTRRIFCVCARITVFPLCRLDEEVKELERKKQSLLEQYKQKKRGSDSSQDGRSPSKKSSVDSGVLLSPPLQKRVVRLQEYEEAPAPQVLRTDSPPAGKSDAEAPVTTSSSLAPAHAHLHQTSPARKQSHDKINEMERRVKEELEADFNNTRRRDDTGLRGSSTNIAGTSHSPLHSMPDLPRQSPVLSEKWSHSTSSTAASSSADTRTHNTFSGFPPTSPTLPGAGRSGSFANKMKSDSNEWTEFACASVSGSSVEVGGSNKPFSVHPSSGETLSSSTNMSEFDPIKTAGSGNSSSAGTGSNSGDPSRSS